MNSYSARVLHRVFCAAAVAFAVFFAPAALAQGNDQAISEPLETLDGKRIDLAKRAGITEIIFVASWCPPCERELRSLRRRTGAVRNQDYQIVVVGVSRRQTSEQFGEWARGFGFSGPLVFDGDGSLEQGFRAQLLPWHVVIGKNGKILHQGDQPPAVEELKTWSKP